MLIGQRIAIAGGGIGGVAAALALALRGAQVEIFEQAPQIAEIGAGVQISPNGTAVLRALGLDRQLVERSVVGKAVHLCNHRNGRVVTTLDLTRLSDAGQWLLVHRSDLLDVLRGAAETAGVHFHLGSRVESVTSTDDRAVLDLSDGRTAEADLVIAADGVRSRLRPQIDAGPAPVFAGHVAWRALLPMDDAVPPEVSVHMGPGRHLVCYPLRDARLLNIVAVVERRDWTPEGWTQPDDPANLQAAFAAFSPAVKALLDKVEKVHLWGLFRHPVAQPWHRGRAVLVGDAAHPTLPFLAQGACMALEDAWVLGECLSAADDPVAGLAAYQAARRERCERIVESANFNAFAYHLEAGPLRAAAHFGLKVGGYLAPGAALARFDWLYRHDVTA